jgi:hypothetical protein
MKVKMDLLKQKIRQENEQVTEIDNLKQKWIAMIEEQTQKVFS